jgi:OOP family OmpA-OmpF porin
MQEAELAYKLTGVVASAMLASLSLFPAGKASAQPVTGIYVGAGAGWNWLQDTDVNVRGTAGSVLRGALPGADSNGKLQSDNGWVGVLSVGWGFGNGLRAELEGNIRENSTDSLSGFGAQRFNNIGGKTRNWGAMANVYYDFDLEALFGGPRWVQPYLGAGIGWARTQLDGVEGVTVNGTRLLIDGEDDVFAYQGIVGLGFPISSVPGLAITTEYRFFGTTKPEIGTRVTTSTGAVGRSNIELSNGHGRACATPSTRRRARRPWLWRPSGRRPGTGPHLPGLLRLGSRGPDRPRPPDHRRGGQNARAVQPPASKSPAMPTAPARPQYNQRLSVRRAEAVAAELVRRGIARSEITIQGFGFDRPLVPTADGRARAAEPPRGDRPALNSVKVTSTSSPTLSEGSIARIAGCCNVTRRGTRSSPMKATLLLATSTPSIFTRIRRFSTNRPPGRSPRSERAAEAVDCGRGSPGRAIRAATVLTTFIITRSPGRSCGRFRTPGGTFTVTNSPVSPRSSTARACMSTVSTMAVAPLASRMAAGCASAAVPAAAMPPSIVSRAGRYRYADMNVSFG